MELFHIAILHQIKPLEIDAFSPCLSLHVLV
jgi:hypothetical protein